MYSQSFSIRKLQGSPGSLPVAKVAAGVLTGVVGGKLMLNPHRGIILAISNKGRLMLNLPWGIILAKYQTKVG